MENNEENKNQENNPKTVNEGLGSINVDGIKKETSQTVQHVKETLKTVNLKEDTEQTKGFLKEMLKNPIGKLKSIIENPAPYMKTAMLLMIVFMLARAVHSISYRIAGFRLNRFFDDFIGELFSALKSGVAPLLGVIVLSAIVLIRNKNKSNSLVNIMTVLIIAKIPSIIGAVISILDIFGSNVGRLTSPINSVCYILSIVLTYFALKFMFDEKDEESFIKQFAVIYGIYCIADIVVGLFGIYI